MYNMFLLPVVDPCCGSRAQHVATGVVTVKSVRRSYDRVAKVKATNYLSTSDDIQYEEQDLQSGGREV